MYCPYCGTRLPDDAVFCSGCGAKIAGPTALQAGFSNRTDSPEVLAALRKIKKSGRLWVFFSSILPFVIAIGVGAFSDKVEMEEALPAGLGISAIFLIVNIINSIKMKVAKPWEGTVIDKETVRGRRGNEKEMRVLYVRTKEGKRRKIEDSMMGSAYDYFEIGDEVRFVPGFPFPYEKKDKSNDDYVICMFCSRKADISEDRCPHCHKPLIK